MRRPPLRTGLLTVLAVAELMLTLDLSIVNVALPAIGAELGVDRDMLQWVVNGYALTFAGVLLLGGRLSDVLGGRRVFLSALGAFGLASLACGRATGFGWLVAARAVQGVSAGVLAPTTLSILTATYRDGESRTRALAVWSAVAIGGGAAGGLLGGVLTGALSWRWIFFVNVPVAAVLLGAGWVRLPRAGEPGARHLDLAGAITVTGGVLTLAWALTRVAETGWGSPGAALGLGIAAALLAGFGVLEARATRDPLVPVAAFRSRGLATGNLLSFLAFVPVMATWFFLTLYVQGVRGFSPLQAGLLFLPVSLAVVGGSQLGFVLMSRVDVRALFVAGGLVAAAGLAMLGWVDARTPLGWVIGAASTAMAGGGLMFAPATVAATSGVPPQWAGLAGGMLNMSRQMGGALGLAVLGSIGTSTAGYAAALSTGAGIFLATAIIGALALPARLNAQEGSSR